MAPQRESRAPDEEKRTDLETGLLRGRRLAKVYRSPAGRIVLVGRDAAANDLLTLKLARPYDVFFHVAGQSGSHVIALNDERSVALDRDSVRFAASLAAAYSSAHRGGKVAVHYARCSDVSKPAGMAAGKVQVRRYKSIQVEPSRQEEHRQDG